jgi:2,3-bisphosphoglycerate-dependent phosphoglycerate mutase
MELYIIRHGQSTNNILSDSATRTCDPSLTDLGIRQAEVVAWHLANGVSRDPFMVPETGYTESEPRRGSEITHLYCSAMHRALQTAAPVAKALGLKPEIWIELHEHGGIYLEEAEKVVGYPGKTRQEIMTEFPNYLLPEKITEKGWWDIALGMETRAASYGRAIQVAHDIRLRAKREPDSMIAIISHGTFIDSLLKALFNQLPATHMYYLHYNTAITRIEFQKNERMLVRHINRVDHLPPEMIS